MQIQFDLCRCYLYFFIKSKLTPFVDRVFRWIRNTEMATISEVRAGARSFLPKLCDFIYEMLLIFR